MGRGREGAMEPRGRPVGFLVLKSSHRVWISEHRKASTSHSGLWKEWKVERAPSAFHVFSSKSSAILMLVKLSRYTWFLSGEDGSHFVGEFEIFHVYAHVRVCVHMHVRMCVRTHVLYSTYYKPMMYYKPTPHFRTKFFHRY